VILQWGFVRGALDALKQEIDEMARNVKWMTRQELVAKWVIFSAVGLFFLAVVGWALYKEAGRGIQLWCALVFVLFWLGAVAAIFGGELRRRSRLAEQGEPYEPDPTVPEVTLKDVLKLIGTRRRDRKSEISELRKRR
jgi:hypothetical protein